MRFELIFMSCVAVNDGEENILRTEFKTIDFEDEEVMDSILSNLFLRHNYIIALYIFYVNINIKIFKNIIVDKVDTTIAAMLLPINIVDNERSNLSMIFNNNLAVLLPSSALI